MCAAAAQRSGALRCRASAAGAASGGVDRGINPRVASLNESKTMALTDLARSMKEAGKPVRSQCGALALLAAASQPAALPVLLALC